MYMYLRSKNSKHGAAKTPYYVGKGKGMRAYSKDHRVRPPVDKTMIVFIARDLSECEAFALEVALIAQYGRIDNNSGCLRNLTDGGEGASGHSESARRKMRDARLKYLETHPSTAYWKGKKRSPETIAKIIQSRTGKPGHPMSEEHKAAIIKFHTGRTRSPEARERMSAARTGTKHVPGQTEKIAAALRGRPRSEETKAKIGAANRGRSISPEMRARISATLTGRHPTEETRQKLIASHVARRDAQIRRAS